MAICDMYVYSCIYTRVCLPTYIHIKHVFKHMEMYVVCVSILCQRTNMSTQFAIFATVIY